MANGNDNKNKATAAEIDLVSTLNKEQKKLLETVKEETKATDKSIASIRAKIKALEDLGVQETDAAAAADGYAKSSAELYRHEAEMAALRGDKVKQIDEEAKLLKLLSERMAAINKDGDETEEQIRKELGLNDDLVKAMKKRQEEFAKLGPMYEKGLEKGTSFATGLATATGIYSAKNTKMFHSFLDGAKTMTSGKGLKGLVKGFFSIINPTNMSIAAIGLIVAETIKMAFAVDKASAAFAAGTGAGRMYTKGINEVASANRRFGIGAADSGKAFETLFSSFRGFNNESKATRDNMAATVAGLEKLGVSGAESAEVINFMNINLGKSGIESAKLTRQMALTGKAIGMTAKQMTSGFKESLKSLAVYGKGAAKVFTNLASQAKAAGVEVSTLLGLADKFDTFSGAADAAGKLNAILGTQLSATELLTMKEDERIETLISSIQAQGIAFKEMGKFEQKAVAAAAGITDMNEAQRIFAMGIGDYRKFQAAAEAGATSQKEFNQRMSDAMDVMKKLQVMAMSFAIAMGPMVEKFGYFVEYLTMFLTMGDGVVAKAIGIVAGVWLLVVAFKAIGGQLLLTKLGLLGVGKSTTPAAAGISKLGTVISAFITKAAASLLEFVAAGSAGLTNFTTAAAAAMAKIGAAAMGAAPGLAAFGVALLEVAVGAFIILGAIALVVIGIALVIAAIAALAYAFGIIILNLIELVKVGMKAPAAFYKVAMGIGILGLALMGLANPLVWYGMTMLAGTLAIIAIAIDSLPVEKLKALSDVLSSLTGGKVGVAIDFSEMDTALNTMVKDAATIQPILGDLALMTVGQNSSGMTANNAMSAIQQFSATMENVFKPEVKVFIGDTELVATIDKRIEISAMK
jgi:hypothetical protein